MLPFFFNQKHSRGCHLFGTGLSSLPRCLFVQIILRGNLLKIFHSLVLLNRTFQNGLFSRNVSKTHKWMSLSCNANIRSNGAFFRFFFNEQIPHCHFIVYVKPACLPRMEKPRLLPNFPPCSLFGSYRGVPSLPQGPISKRLEQVKPRHT